MPDARRTLIFRSVPDVAATLVFLTGCVVLSGWLFGIEALKLTPAHMVRMKANAALAFILCGASLFLTGTDLRWSGRIAQAMAITAALLGFLTLCEYATGVDLRIDQLLAHETAGTIKTSSPNRMAPNAALNFVLAGVALVLLNARKGDWLVSVLALAAGAISLLALMGNAYATEAGPLFVSYTHIALLTASAFFVLASGILFALRDRGMMAVLTSRGLDGRLSRRLMPAVILFPLLLGWLRYQGERAGLWGDEFGVALMVSSCVTVLAIVVWQSAEAVARSEAGRLEALEALSRHADELARSNEELEKFAYVASHDLQEPLRMIAGFSQMLSRRYKGRLDSDADEFIGFVVDGATRMQALINDLLAYSRVGRNGASLRPAECADALDGALSNLKTAIDESGATIDRTALPIVSGDPAQLAQLFQNLVGNALKFRGADAPVIRVSASENGGDWVISVRDNGIGIDPKYFDRIFMLFQRLHTREEYPGTGLGLAICKKIVERHGGRIWAESEPGKGTAFHFSIPTQRMEAT